MKDPTKCILHETDGSERELPTVFAVCDDCQGKGQTSKYNIGAITAEERDRDWSHDEWDDYMAGAYDETCPTCKGRRVVAVVDRSRLDAETLAAWDEQCVADADYEALCAMERRMGA